MRFLISAFCFVAWTCLSYASSFSEIDLVVRHEAAKHFSETWGEDIKEHDVYNLTSKPSTQDDCLLFVEGLLKHADFGTHWFRACVFSVQNHKTSSLEADIFETKKLAN